MSCDAFNLGGGWVIVECGRSAGNCSVPGCTRAAAALCDYPVTRRGRAGTCSAKLCATHRRSVGPDRDLCPAHAKQQEIKPMLTVTEDPPPSEDPPPPPPPEDPPKKQHE
jgi:hypothetical protein